MRYQFDKNMLYGVHIGEHSFAVEDVIDEINERVISKGYNFVTIRTRARFGEIIPIETYRAWAEHLAKNKIYFLFLYSMQTKGELKSSFNKEMVDMMREVAGEYFLGDMVGELGSCFGAKDRGYASENKYASPRQDHESLASAADAFVSIVKEYTELDRSLCMPYISSVEPTALAKYIDMGGVDLPMLELMCANADILLPYVRGMSRAFGRNWGTYMAHEWYGGVYHADTLKRKRILIGAKLAYLAGSSVFCIESGDTGVYAYGEHHSEDSDVCRDYRDMLDYIKSVSDSEMRDKSGPRVKLAFVSGRYDAFSGWGGSSVFGQYDKPEWGYSDAEHGYSLLAELGQKRPWSDIENYGENDLSSFPPYGQYDIVPIEADVEALKKYEYLIFLGWSTMTDADMDKLIEYVECGGKLLMSAAHLNYSDKRGGEYIYPDNERMARLFGITLTGEELNTNAGIKFVRGDDRPIYPGTLPDKSDPILTSGYVDYLVPSLCGAEPLAYLSDGFKSNTRVYPPVVVANKLGRGTATLALSKQYPGNAAALPLYKTLMRATVTDAHRTADVRVIASDRLRYSLYEDGRMYLLNTDYDLPITVKIIKGEREITLSLDSLEMKIIEI